LKSRWRILKIGIRTRRLADADMIWKTCCALHNMLLEVDGNDVQWVGASTLMQQQEIAPHILPAAVQTLNNPDATLVRGPPTSEAHEGGDSDDNHQQEEGTVVAPPELTHERIPQAINQMSLKLFRQKLVTHFYIAFTKHEVDWPTKRNRAIADRGVPARGGNLLPLLIDDDNDANVDTDDDEEYDSDE